MAGCIAALRRLLDVVAPSRVRRPDPPLQAGRLAASLMPGRTALDVLHAVHVARVLGAGETGRDILRMRMEASAMGPMNERLRSDISRTVAAMRAGREPAGRWAAPLDATVDAAVRQACGLLADLTSAQITAFVHREGSSWEICWRRDEAARRPNAEPRRNAWRGPVITLEAMIADHRDAFGDDAA